jgi:hypothetical protein
MENVLGKRMIDEGLVTPEQVEKALDRQKSKGGRLGENLVALGLIKEDKLATFFKNIPREPKNLEETGLDPGFISELAMKHIYFMGTFTLKDLAEAVKLPIFIMDQTVQSLRKDKICEVKGGTGYATSTYQFSITELGRKRAQESLDMCNYIGAAPVTLADYTKQMQY